MSNNDNARILPSPPPLPTDEALIEIKCANSSYKKWNETLSSRWPTTASSLKDATGEFAADKYCNDIKTRVAETCGVHKSDV